MKKFVGFIMVMVLLMSLIGGAYAQPGNVWEKVYKDGGKYTYETKVIKEAIPAIEAVEAVAEVPEIAEWSFKELEDLRVFVNIVNKNDYKIIISSDGLKYDIKVHKKIGIVGTFVVKEKKGTFAEVIGNKELELTWTEGNGQNKNKKITLTFEIIKTITQAYVAAIPAVEAVAEVPAETQDYITGYKFVIGKHKGCEVVFNKDLKLLKDKATLTKLLAKKPYIVGKANIWEKGRWFWSRHTYLYFANSWNCPVVSPSPTDSTDPSTTPTDSTTPSTEPSTTPVPTESDIPTDVVSEEPVETVVSPVVTPTSTTVYNNGDVLPKTGEGNPFNLIIIGLALIGMGVTSFVIVRKRSLVKNK